MAAQTYTSNLRFPNNYQDAPSQDTPVLAADLNMEADLLNEIVFRPYQLMGAGVIRGRLNQFNVTAGSGLSVVVSSGVGIVGTDALFVPVWRTTAFPALTGLEANRTSSNPLYLFLVADDGAGPNPPSTISRVPIFQVSDYNTLTGAVLLAQITTNGASVTSVTDMRQYAGDATRDGSGHLAKSVAGGSDITLTATEAANLNLEFTGTLTANISVIVPTTRRMWRVYNRTSGAFTLTVKTAGGSGVVVVQGSQMSLESDGTNVVVTGATSVHTIVPVKTAVASNIAATTERLEVTANGNTTQTLPNTRPTTFTGKITVKNRGSGTITMAATSPTTMEMGYTIGPYQSYDFDLDTTTNTWMGV